MVPRTVLTKPGPITLNTARPVNTVQPSNKQEIMQEVTTVNTAKPKAVVNTVRQKAVLSAVKGNKGNVVKASAYPSQLMAWVAKETNSPYHLCRIMKKLMDDLLPLEEIPKEGKLLGKKEFSVVRTPQQNGVAERKNRTLIDATRTMLAKLNYQQLSGLKQLILLVMCPVTILTTIDHLGKFDGKADKGFFVGYSTNSKAFRVLKYRTSCWKRTCMFSLGELTYYCRKWTNWLFDIRCIKILMNYKPVVVGNQSNGNVGTKACDNACKARMETIHGKDYILLPVWPVDLLFSQDSKSSPDAGFKPSREEEKKDAEDLGNESGNPTEGRDSEVPKVNAVDPKRSIELPNDPNMPELEDIVYSDVGVEADMNNLDAFMPVSPILTTRIHKDHPVDQIIRDLNSAPQTRRMTNNLKEHGLFSSDLPNGERAIGTKWVYRNKKDERGIMIKNKARLVAQWYIQEEGIDYDEVFAPIARIEAIRLFLAYASFTHFVVYQMDVKSAFLYGKIEEEVYVCQPPGFEDPDFPNRVYKVEKVFYGLHQALRACKNHSTGNPQKALLKDADGEDVDEYLYRSMIGSLMYLTSSRPDIMFTIVVANSTTEAEYIATSNSCGQVMNPVFTQ
ncbi:putative ribonuclease H-like domain-containing protein [Tanacetum coccineum]